MARAVTTETARLAVPSITRDDPRAGRGNPWKRPLASLATFLSEAVMDVSRKAQRPIKQPAGSPAHAPVTQAPVKTEKQVPVSQAPAVVEKGAPAGVPDARKAYAGSTTTQTTQNTPSVGAKNLFLRFDMSIGSPALKRLAGPLKEIARQDTAPPPPGTTQVKFETAKGALIGLPGAEVTGYKDGKIAEKFDATAIPRQPNLTAEERAWETSFSNKFAQNPRATVAEYEAHVGDKHIFEVDLAKRCFPDWGQASKPANDGEKRIRAEANTALHATAVGIAKAAFLKRLDEMALMPADAPERQVLVTSGGCAAGKGSLTDLLKVNSPDLTFGATWDAAGEGDALENRWILQEASKRGIPVMFGYVHNNPMEQFKSVLGRAGSQGRMVDLMTFTNSYVEGARNMKDFVASPEFRAAREKGLASSFSLFPGKFNVESIKDKTQAPYPEMKVLPSKDGIPSIPPMPESGKIMQRALELIDEASSAGNLPSHLVTGALAGMARRWPDLAAQHVPELKGILNGARQ